MNIESDHFKTLEELIDTIKMWVKNEEEYYDRWFGLNEMNILVKEIERLKERLEEYQKYVDINHKEIERLNNIINKLEKYLWEERYNHHGEYVLSGRKAEDIYTLILDKLEELKGVKLTENDKKQVKWLKEEFKVGDNKE